MGFSRQEHWSGLPSPPPGDLPDPGIKSTSLISPALAGRLFTTSASWEAQQSVPPRYVSLVLINSYMGFLGGTMVKNPPAHAGDTRDVGSIPGSGRSPGNPLRYSCLEIPWTEKLGLAGYSPWGHNQWDMTSKLHNSSHRGEWSQHGMYSTRPQGFTVGKGSQNTGSGIVTFKNREKSPRQTQFHCPQANISTLTLLCIFNIPSGNSTPTVRDQATLSRLSPEVSITISVSILVIKMLGLKVLPLSSSIFP